MKWNKLSFFVLCAFLGIATQAQTLEIVDTKLNQQGIIGQDLRTVIKIKNITNSTTYFKIQELKKQIGSSQKSYLCINNDCANGNIARSSEKYSTIVHKLESGQISEAIVAVLETGLVEGIGSVSYLISIVNGPEEFLEVELQYEVIDRPSEGLLYSSLNVDLSDVYPNPVTETAIFDYTIKNDSKEAKIIIHNVLGSVAGEYKLNPYEQQLKISVENFNPGVYFYSLYIDNEGVATKKLVVRK